MKHHMGAAAVMMTFAGVCEGIGGFKIAFEAAGMRSLWSCEIDAKCNRVRRHHWPDETHYLDMLTLPLDDLERPDIFCGGTPCQAFSVSGNRQSLKDARGNLTLAFVTIANALGSKLIVWENVPGVLSTNDNAFGSFLGALVGAGRAIPGIRDGKWPSAGMVIGPERVVGWRCLDAQYYGLAQRRNRVIVVGHSRNLGRLVGETPEQESSRLCSLLSEILFESDGMRRATYPCRKKGKKIARPLTTGFSQCPSMQTYIVDTERLFAIQHAQIGRKDSAGPQGKGYREDVAFTLDATATADAISYGKNVRRLTPIESARLQGFPDEWNGFLSDGARYKQYGNAVAVPVFEWLGKRIVNRVGAGL